MSKVLVDVSSVFSFSSGYGDIAEALCEKADGVSSFVVSETGGGYSIAGGGKHTPYDALSGALVHLVASSGTPDADKVAGNLKLLFQTVGLSYDDAYGRDMLSDLSRDYLVDSLDAITCGLSASVAVSETDGTTNSLVDKWDVLSAQLSAVHANYHKLMHAYKEVNDEQSN